MLFKRFQSEWENLDRSTDNLTLFEWPEQSSDLWTQAESVRSWALDCITKKMFPREDYRELREFTLVFL
jgi:hypothetical protein